MRIVNSESAGYYLIFAYRVENLPEDVLYEPRAILIAAAVFTFAGMGCENLV